ncbi:carbohydrate ABC transporter permease [Peribacillus frigoritolerans]|uniref:Carbohydrate ABC transporter permease n=1 Tax=Peribacillus frigoritolerans TaxID=450367 RepID=A0AAJ1QQM3_9BACI|nr:carbohydrate ABC transporter permease [Peribacillus frigoritolerans]MDM5285531.1 carbohydrate ABC transporter permease [Peribacillus frigoritolerans]QYF84806.1 carbohydrate ABC transporter permease [Brevibacterium sp. PAMC21349]
MQRKASKAVIVILAILIGLMFLVPIFWMLATSFKSDQEAFTAGLKWLPEVFTLENYTYALSGDGETPVLSWMANSLFVGIIGTLIVLVVDTLAAYGLARLDVPFKKLLIGLFIGSLTIPWVITFLPLYMEFNTLGLLDTYAVLILPYSANAFGVFLLYQYFRTFPRELEEAAFLDGANKWQVFTKVVLPSARPVIWTLGIFTFMGIYNDFLWPLVTTSSPEMRTITTGIAIMQQGSFVSSPAKLMALTSIATIPAVILFIIGQRSFIKGVNQTGIK